MGVVRPRLHVRLPRPAAGRRRHAGAVRRPRDVAVRRERGDARPARRAPHRPGPGRRPLDAGVLPVAGARDRRADLPRRPRRTGRGPATGGGVTRPWGLYPCADGLRVVPRHPAGALEGDGDLDRRGDRHGLRARRGVQRHARALGGVGLHRRAHRAAHDAVHEARPVHRGPAAGHPHHAGQHRGRPAQRSAPARAPASGATTSTRCSARCPVRARRSASTTTGGSGRRRRGSASTPTPCSPPCEGEPTARFGGRRGRTVGPW